MEIDEDDLDFILENASESHKVSCVLTIDGVSYQSLVRIHGGSSRYYRKKSFRFDLASGSTLPNGSNHIVLRAEWADKSMLRNYLALETFRYGTWIPTPEAQIVHFRINDRYYGAMWHVERIDGDFLRSRGINPEGSMYEADPEPEFWMPGANLTPLRYDELYPHIYQHQKGSIDYDDLIELIEETLQLKEEVFDREFKRASMSVRCLSIWRPMRLFRIKITSRRITISTGNPVGVDTRWVVFPWDLDLSLGHLWTEEDDILSEELFFDGSLYVGQRVPEHSYYNQLISRLLGVPAFEERFLEYTEYIAENVLTPDFIGKRIDNVLCLAGRDIMADERKRAPEEEYLDCVDEIRLFVNERRDFILP